LFCFVLFCFVLLQFGHHPHSAYRRRHHIPAVAAAVAPKYFLSLPLHFVSVPLEDDIMFFLVYSH
jgi:hypothetical protein